MQSNDRITKIFLITLEGTGAIVVGIFLVAYLGGMFMDPSTTVLHMNPAFRFPLIVSGAALLVLILAGAILSSTRKALY